MPESAREKMTRKTEKSRSSVSARDRMLRRNRKKAAAPNVTEGATPAKPAAKRVAIREKAAARKKVAASSALTARTADKHVLYEDSVQAPEADIKFLNRVFKKQFGRKPMSLREDFCGTALTCSRWVKTDKQRTAVGVDLDQPTLDWGIEKHIKPLGEAADRVTLLNQNVLEVTRPKVDVAVAFNFSYCVFHQRQELKKYLQAAKKSLGPEGLFVLDLHGGPEAFEAVEEETEHDDFTYVWDQDAVDAVSHHAIRSIHFRFPDGSEMKNAFRYDWRVWTLPELRDLMEEAGFDQVDVYWEGYDSKTNEGNGVFRRVEKAENDESWIAYLLGWKLGSRSSR